MITLFNHSEPLAIIPSGIPKLDASISGLHNVASTPSIVNIEDGLAIVNLHGPVMRTAPGYAREFLDKIGIEYVISPETVDAITEAANNPGVRAIVIDVDSPGGQVNGTPELADAVRAAASVKPCYAYTAGLCASAAYWVASQCDAIYNAPSAYIGSIGVLCVLEDYTDAAKQKGIKYNIIQAGKYKTAGAAVKPLTDDERDLFQMQVDNIFAQFKSYVNSRRNLSDDVMQGQVFYGTEAVENGLTDATCNSLRELCAKIRRRHC